MHVTDIKCFKLNKHSMNFRNCCYISLVINQKSVQHCKRKCYRKLNSLRLLEFSGTLNSLIPSEVICLYLGKMKRGKFRYFPNYMVIYIQRQNQTFVWCKSSLLCIEMTFETFVFQFLKFSAHHQCYIVNYCIQREFGTLMGLL